MNKNCSVLYTQYKNLIKDDLFLRPYSVHGIQHTKRVLWLASQITDIIQLNHREEIILALACCYHDIGRINDCYDEEHGALSAKKVIKLGLLDGYRLNNDEIELVLGLITMHSLPDDIFVGRDKPLLLYQILKDADALDRIRLGKGDLDPAYLRLEVSKGLIGIAEDLFEGKIEM